MKTLEQMAEEWVSKNTTGSETYEHGLRNGFFAGYQAAMNSPEKPDSWISVKERLPEHGVPVLVFDTLANTIELMSWDKIMEVFETDDAYFVQLNDASHWMPLPEPPKGEA